MEINKPKMSTVGNSGPVWTTTLAFEFRVTKKFSEPDASKGNLQRNYNLITQSSP